MVDDQTYVFDLRKDVKFHDGRPLTAADVKYTYESMLTANNRSPKRSLLKPLQAIDQIGHYQLRFRLSAPHAPFPDQFTLEIVPASRNEDSQPSANQPAGSAPFVLQPIDPG